MLRPRTKQAERTNYPFPCPIVLLGWPKGSFKLFHKMLQKTGKSFLVNPIFGSSMDWMKPTHIERGPRWIDFTQSSDSNANLVWKHPDRHA